MTLPNPFLHVPDIMTSILSLYYTLNLRSIILSFLYQYFSLLDISNSILILVLLHIYFFRFRLLHSLLVLFCNQFLPFLVQSILVSYLSSYIFISPFTYIHITSLSFCFSFIYIFSLHITSSSSRYFL